VLIDYVAEHDAVRKLVARCVVGKFTSGFIGRDTVELLDFGEVVQVQAVVGILATSWYGAFPCFVSETSCRLEFPSG